MFGKPFCFFYFPSRYGRKHEGHPCMKKGMNGTWLMLFDKILLLLKFLRVALKDLSQTDAKDIKNLGIRQVCL